MIARLAYASLVLLGLTINPACRTSKGPDSKILDEQTDLIKETIPGGLANVVVPTEDIGVHIEPATGDNGIPPSLNGIWWTDAKTIQFVISFKNAAWNSKTRTSSLVYVGPGTYSFQPGTRFTLPKTGTIGNPDLQAFAGYDITFNESFDKATMLTALSYMDGTRKAEHQAEGDFTLNFVEDGVWRRDTPGKDSYFLRRIIDEKGNKTPVFKDFLRVFGPKASIFKPTMEITEDSPSLKIPLKAGTSTFVNIKGNGRDQAGLDYVPYQLSFNAPFPLEVRSFGRSGLGKSRSSQEPYGLVASVNKSDSFVAIRSEKDGNAEITLSRAELRELKEGTSTLKLKGNIPNYFFFEKRMGGDKKAYMVKVTSDSPTDIWFNSNRSAGRLGQKENSLWVSTSGMEDINRNIIMLEPKTDSVSQVQVSPTEMKIRKREPIKADGAWHDATLESLETVDIWTVADRTELVVFEIEETGQKRSAPELYLGQSDSDLSYIDYIVQFGRYEEWEDKKTLKSQFKRELELLAHEVAFIQYGWQMQGTHKPTYRVRAKPLQP